jgi:hypothetical protein
VKPTLRGRFHVFRKRCRLRGPYLERCDDGTAKSHDDTVGGSIRRLSMFPASTAASLGSEWLSVSLQWGV